MLLILCDAIDDMGRDTYLDMDLDTDLDTLQLTEEITKKTPRHSRSTIHGFLPTTSIFLTNSDLTFSRNGQYN